MSFCRPLGLIAACLIMAACAAPSAGAPPELRVVAANLGDTVTVEASAEALLIDVQSPRGVGAATVELLAGDLPTTARVRLHLAGLEEFRLSYGTTEIIAGLGPGGELLQRLVDPNTGEQPISPDSPYWMPVSQEAPQADSPAPAPIIVTLPPDLIQGRHRSFTIHWVDFYR